MKVKAYRVRLNASRYPDIVAENGNYVCDGRRAFNSPEIVYEFCETELDLVNAAEEYVYIFSLDNKCHLTGLCELSHGSYNASIVSTREVFTRLLLLGATNFLMVHNHPSGDASPSREDDTTTQKLKEAGLVLDVTLSDHIIIGDGSYYSYRQEGRL
jgi:DNA repair protein RadC